MIVIGQYITLMARLQPFFLPLKTSEWTHTGRVSLPLHSIGCRSSSFAMESFTQPGFCGSGAVWARWLGQKAALMILGRDGESVFSNLPLRTMPFYTVDPWFMPLAISYYKLGDSLSASTK